MFSNNVRGNERNLLEQLAAVHEANKKWQSAHAALLSDLHLKDDEVKNLQADFQKKIFTLQTKTQDQQIESLRTQVALEIAQAAISSLTGEMESTKAIHEEEINHGKTVHRAEVEQLQADFQEVVESLQADFQEIVDKLQSDVKDQQIANFQTQMALEKAQATINSLTGEMESAKATHEAEIKKIEDSFENRTVQQGQTNLRMLENQLREIEAIKKHSIEEIKSAKATYEANIKKLEDALNKRVTKITELEELIPTLKDAVKQSKTEGFSGRLHQLQAENVMLKKENDSLHKKKRENVGLQNENTRLQKENKAQAEKIAQLEIQMQRLSTEPAEKSSSHNPMIFGSKRL